MTVLVFRKNKIYSMIYGKKHIFMSKYKGKTQLPVNRFGWKSNQFLAKTNWIQVPNLVHILSVILEIIHRQTYRQTTHIQTDAMTCLVLHFKIGKNANFDKNLRYKFFLWFLGDYNVSLYKDKEAKGDILFLI